MKEITYYSVTFDRGLMIGSIMSNRNFEKFQGAVKYLNAVMDKAKEKCSQLGDKEDTISDYAKECPFEKEYSYTRQITTQDASGYCRIYCGSVTKKHLYLK